ncbi:AAA family ATPase [Clostridium tagluense]|uniref:AAA family ATPase n=1 Tax=Clostridium tagluense TaxID=360422 RepID=UPI001CF2BE99|nr:AAA family ATPase [Clostridium tagluense]MCB2310451.1 AAA family ATPase [Clostridium tagluense]MCB2315383.1 AAA family ATPase [Clostridium tagluense]MCB2320234.1 AAA family ATPase [Clostridium tagluense]MCB2325125.1 AAA family ATPase [Clostridium tagluense]MCB2329977.1 AAA family ATPase [Clostridium tagluense]
MGLLECSQYLRSIQLNKDDIESFSKYPFCLPAIEKLSSLEFHPKVTFIVGENGSGKSTILEAIATAYGFNPEGGTINFNFSSMDTHSELYKYIKLVKGVKKPKNGFFLRAESFYNLATNIDELERVSPGLVSSYGGQSLHKQSHGESFFAVFMNRFGSNGLYILDEPEAALSPSRQMSMLTRINELIKLGSQFIIATHSPIIMAYPESTIYEIKEKIEVVEYEETENYQTMKSFINNRSRMLDILMEGNH